MYKEYEQMNRNATIVARGTLELAMITISEPIESLDVWCFIWLCARNTMPLIHSDSILLSCRDFGPYV